MAIPATCTICGDPVTWDGEKAIRMPKHDYDTTLARIAGNIAAGLVAVAQPRDNDAIAREAVALARLIVDRVREAPVATVVELRGEHPEIPVSAMCILNGCQHRAGKQA
jgi:hypothetical protein